MRQSHICFLGILFCASSIPANAQEPEEAWKFSLDTVTVRGNRFTHSLQSRSNGSLSWNMQLMDDLPKILGNADPMHYAQMLPGVQTNNEFKSGINIQGCDNSHNLLSIGGVPIYNVNHLLGFFSTFNPSHYPTFTLYRSTPIFATGNRIGGELTMELDNEPADSISGECSIGLISSQGTLRLPIGRNTSLTASARASYLNLLYSRWLRPDGQQVRYSFYDVNATLTHRLNSHHTLQLDCYNGSDHLSFQEDHYFADMSDNWGNTVGALHWHYQDGAWLKLRNTWYVTSYWNRFQMALQDARFQLPSSITDAGYHGLITWKRLSAGIDAIWHHIQPQELETTGTFNLSPGTYPSVNSAECAAFADYTQPLSGKIALHGGVKFSLYHQREATYQAADPSVGLTYNDDIIQATASYSLKHQYLFQTGFSNIGLPSEFWLSCSDKRRPQYVHDLSLYASAYFLDRTYRLSADVFFKQLYHQIEYNGSVLDYMNSAYDIESQLLYGDGRNYGFSLMLNKCAGKLTGWLSYTYTHAHRTFSQISASKSFPANHERPHELNAVAICSPNPHWSFGATFVYASGSPFTAPVYIALINGNLLMKYGEHNANRLKPYSRLDLSVNYKWSCRWLREQGVNLSLYNATAHSNELFYYIKNRDDGSFAYHPVKFMVDVLPSVSYFCKF